MFGGGYSVLMVVLISLDYLGAFLRPLVMLVGTEKQNRLTGRHKMGVIEDRHTPHHGSNSIARGTDLNISTRKF